jgi:hypothetical protein
MYHFCAAVLVLMDTASLVMCADMCVIVFQVGDEDDVDTVDGGRTRKKPNLTAYEVMLRKFRYADALDAALKVCMCVSCVSERVCVMHEHPSHSILSDHMHAFLDVFFFCT